MRDSAFATGVEGGVVCRARGDGVEVVEARGERGEGGWFCRCVGGFAELGGRGGRFGVGGAGGVVDEWGGHGGLECGGGGAGG